MSDLTIRPTAEPDRAAVEAVAAEALLALEASPSVAQWGSAMRRSFIEHWFPPLGDPSGRRMLVAEDDGALIGAGSTLAGRRHPHSFMRIAVRRDARASGVGAALFEALTRHEDRPMAVREMLSDPDTIAFYRRRGFVTGERTVEGRIDPTDPATKTWVDLVLQQRSRLGVAPGPSAASNLDLAQAADALYGWTHPWSPPRRLGDDEAIAMYLRTLRAEGVVTAWIDDELVALSLLTESPFGAPATVSHLALCGVVDPGRPGAAAITRRLLAATIRYAGQRNWTIEVEANEPNEPLWDAVWSVPGADLFSDMTMLVDRYGG